MHEKLNVIDVFCGAGGFSYGFENVGYSVLLGIDAWKPAIRTFSSNHNGLGLEADMRELSVDEIKGRLSGSDKKSSYAPLWNAIICSI